MRKRRSAYAMVGLALAALLLGSCKSGDSTGPSASVDLSGTYSLVSLTQAGQTVGPPLVTGTLVLTKTTYSVTINIPGQSPEIDTGTYTATADHKWTQSSQAAQSQGTYSLSGNTLTVSVTTPTALNTVWQRQ